MKLKNWFLYKDIQSNEEQFLDKLDEIQKYGCAVPGQISFWKSGNMNEHRKKTILFSCKKFILTKNLKCLPFFFEWSFKFTIKLD